MHTRKLFSLSIKLLSLFFVAILLSGLALSLEPLPVARAASFNVADGDVYGPNGLIAAINIANNNGQTNVIHLARGGIYSLTSVNNSISGDTGLPAITSTLLINGNGSTIERLVTPPAPSMRIFYITSTGNLTLNNLTIQHGRESNGGAIYNQAGTLSINTSSVIANDGMRGGAINNSGGTLTITNSTIAANTGMGGGLYNSDGTATITNSTFTLNAANDVDGGAIFNGSSTTGGSLTTLTIVNTSIVGNRSVRTGSGFFGSGGAGGGILNQGGSATTTLVLTNSTLAQNIASGLTGNGTIYTVGTAAAATTTTLFNTIVADNSSWNCLAGANGTYNSGSNNLEYPGPVSCGTGSTVAATDPLSSTGLANNGGPTQTVALAPLPNQAIDGGNAAYCPARDQRYASRINVCDIGSYEYNGTLALPPVLSTAFTPNTITSGDNSSLSFTITNPNSDLTLTDITFSDLLPSGVVRPVGLVAGGFSCLINNAGSSFPPQGSGGKIEAWGINLAANQSCGFSLLVTSSTLGTVTNTISSIFSNETGTATINAHADLTVNCTNALTVTSNLDNGACNTLRSALAAAHTGDTISIALPSTPATIKLSVSGLNVPSGITVNGLCNPTSKKPDITVDGTGISGDGLTLNGSTKLTGLSIKGFEGKQIYALKGGNQLKCVTTSKN